MSAKISLIVNVQVVGGPKVSSSQSFDAAGYDFNEYVIPHGGVEQTVDVGPGNHMKLVQITADRYDLPVTYMAFDGGAGKPKISIALDSPQLFTGAGMLAMFELTPNKLKITNTDATRDVTVQILVGRTS